MPCKLPSLLPLACVVPPKVPEMLFLCQGAWNLLALAVMWQGRGYVVRVVAAAQQPGAGEVGCLQGWVPVLLLPAPAPVLPAG